MTLVNIDLRNQGYETSPGDRVVFYSLVVREGDFGTISTAPVEVELTDGKASVDLAPGPVGVQIIAGQVADTRVREGKVPAEGPTTLNVVLTLLPDYSPAVREEFLRVIRGAQDEALTRIDAEVAVAVGAEMDGVTALSEEALSRAKNAEGVAATADAKSTSATSTASTAESTASNAIDRVTALEALSGLSPESPVDGQTANIVLQSDSLTRKALGQTYFSRELGSEFFEAPPQPSFNALDPGHVWDGDGRTIADFITEKFDPLMADHPDLVTRTVLGKDASGTYDIIEYDIHPAGATQTILLQSGMHGRETVPVYSMYRFMHYLLNDPDLHPDLRFLRDTVRIKLIPNLGVWAGSQQPKVYSNANNWNINRNFPVNREYMPLTGATSGRGPAPLSEAEAQILHDWYQENRGAAFIIDFHTDYSFYGQLPSRDVWVMRPAFGEVWSQAVDPIVGRMASRVREKHGRVPVVHIEDGGSATSAAKYAMEVLGIPHMTLEFCETRFGGRFAGHEDIQNHLTYAVNFVSGLARQRIRDQVNAEKRVDRNRIARMKRPFNFYSDQANVNWSLPTLYVKIDQMVTDNPGYATVTNLGADQSGAYQIRPLTLAPKHYRRTIALIGGLESMRGVDTMLLYQLAYMLCYEWRDYGLEDIRRDTRFVIIPTLNPWGYNKNAVDLNTTAFGIEATATVLKEPVNSAGAQVSRNIATSTQAETIILRDLLATNAGVWDALIGMQDTVQESTTLGVRYGAGANLDIARLALQLGESVLKHHTPIQPGTTPVQENWVGMSNQFSTWAGDNGHPNSVHLSLSATAFRDGVHEHRSLNRPTALAHMSYLLDLVDAVRTVI